MQSNETATNLKDDKNSVENKGATDEFRNL